MNEPRLNLTGMAQPADRFFLLVVLTPYGLGTMFLDCDLRIGETTLSEFDLGRPPGRFTAVPAAELAVTET
jgi:hypothetical protein